MASAGGPPEPPRHARCRWRLFLLPILDLGGYRVAAFSLGLTLILFVGHAFALAGHCELFTQGERGERMVPEPGCASACDPGLDCDPGGGCGPGPEHEHSWGDDEAGSFEYAPRQEWIAVASAAVIALAYSAFAVAEHVG